MGRPWKNVFIVLVLLGLTFIVDKSMHQIKDIKTPQLSPPTQKPIAESRSPKSAECREGLVYNLKESRLDKIQKERKSTVKEVCKMCRRNGSSTECNHVSLDEDSHFPGMYENFYVDEKHKVK